MFDEVGRTKKKTFSPCNEQINFTYKQLLFGRCSNKKLSYCEDSARHPGNYIANN